MSIAYSTNGTAVQSASAATLSPGKPTVATNGGVLVAVVLSKNNATHSTTTTGWNVLRQANSGASFTVSVWIADESAAAPVFSWTGAAACYAVVYYLFDIAGPISKTISAIGSTTTGTTTPHTGTGFTTDDNNTLEILIDACSINTAFTAPTGWTRNSSAVGATSLTAIGFCSKSVSSSGTATGSTSSAGGAAAYAQFQFELKSLAAVALESSKLEATTWIEVQDGLSVPKIEATTWLDGNKFEASKFEITVWLDRTGRTRRMSLM